MMASDKDDAPHPVDVYVGRQMRLRRVQLGLSQGTLAAKLGVSFQAVQKYEAGAIRISASRLYDIAQALEIAPGFFFEGYGGKPGEQRSADEPGESVFHRHDILALVRGYGGIKDPGLRALLLRLITRLGNQPVDER